MTIVSSGSLTIVDLDDVKQLLSYIGSSQSKVVIYNPDNNIYVPNYSSTNQTLTPQLFIAGEPNDIINSADSVTWYKQYNGTGQLIKITQNDSDYTLNNNKLIIKNNIFQNYNTMHYICEIIYTDPESNLSIPIKSDIELIKVTNGQKGNAIVGVLSSDSHVIPTNHDGSNGNYLGASTTMIIYDGITDVSNLWTASVTEVDGVIGSLVGMEYIVTNLTKDSGFVTLTAKREGYSDIQKKFSLSKNKSGADSTINWLVIDAHVIQKDSSGNLLPETIKISAKSQKGLNDISDYLGRFRVSERINGNWGFPLYSSHQDESILNYTPSHNIKAIKVELFSSGGFTNLLDEEIIPVISDGKAGRDSLTAILSNDTATIGTDEFGDNGNYSSASTTMTILEGVNDVSNQWTYSFTKSEGVIGYLDNNTYYITNLTTDSGYVDIIASRSGYTNLIRRFSISKSKAGSGENAVSYWLIVNTSILKLKNNIYTPNEIKIEAKSQTGLSSPSPYNSRFIISESTDGITYSNKYTSIAGESVKNYTPSQNIVSVRVQMYLAGGTSNLLDEQVIPVVIDGSDGEDSIIANVWTPNGNTLKNSSGNLTAMINLYKGSDLVSPTLYKWYKQDSGATISNDGDSDGGNGWRLLKSTNNEGISGYTTDTITIPANAIHSMATFKCIVVYNNKKYQDTTTVIDMTDPITVSIIGSNIFKNGIGQSQFYARLYRSGEEIDESGAGYNYAWSLYFSDGSASIAFGVKQGKAITVNSSDFIARANLICEVSEK